MFRPDETGGLGLTDTTAEHAMQAAGLALPRREPYFRRSRIYAEAESNANEFALACFVRRRRKALDSRIQRAEHAMQAAGLALPRREPYFRRSRISQKPRA